MDVLKNGHHQIEDRQVFSILETVEVASGQRRVVREFNHLIEAPNWTRDGRELVYNARGRIFSLDLASGDSRAIETGLCDHCNNDHVLSPDNLRIAVSHHTHEDGLSRIYILPLAGGRPELITPIAPSYLHGWSPDGLWLAYCAERNGAYNIYRIPASGGIEEQLTDAEGLSDGPEYSPDGRFIWFNSVRSGLMQLWRMRADGTEPTRMTSDQSNNWFPHLSPDGSTVAFITYRLGDVLPGDHPPNKQVGIRLMPAGGGEPRTLVDLFGGQGSLNVNSWSPDGSQLAFVSYRLK